MINVENVNFEYIRRSHDGEILGVELALDEVSFEVKKGEFVAIVGHNGSGKSTLARLINALILPGEGNVVVDNIDTSEEERVFEVRRRVGMVFQNPDNQIVQNIVEDDVCFGPENIGMDPEIMKIRVQQAMKVAGVYDVKDESPNRLSGGQKQRVAIAGVLAMKPKCIIFDEATAMIDPMGTEEIMRFVMELNEKEKITVLWITHDMNEVIMADKVLVMNKGKLEMCGTPREVFRDPKRVEKCHLDLPQVVKLNQYLISRGIDMPRNIINASEFVNEFEKRYL